MDQIAPLTRGKEIGTVASALIVTQTISAFVVGGQTPTGSNQRQAMSPHRPVRAGKRRLRLELLGPRDDVGWACCAVRHGGRVSAGVADDLVQRVLIPEQDPELDHATEDQHEGGIDQGELIVTDQDLTLLDHAGAVVVRGAIGLVNPQHFQTLTAVGAEGCADDVRYTTESGVDVIAACALVPGPRWMVVLAEPTAMTIEATQREIVTTTVFLAGWGVFFAIVIVAVFGRPSPSGDRAQGRRADGRGREPRRTGRPAGGRDRRDGPARDRVQLHEHAPPPEPRHDRSEEPGD